MNTSKYLIVTIIILSIFLVSCGENTITETVTLSITTTVAPSPFLSLTNTQTQNPTNTIAPTKTPNPTTTNTPTTTIQPTPTIPRETITVLETVKAFLPICNPGVFWETSQDRQWIVDRDCIGGNSENALFHLKVLNILDGREWQVDFDTVEFGYDDGSFWPEHWSKDGRFLFVSVFRQMDGGGFEFMNATMLLRLNLLTGEVTQILPDGFHTFAFSPGSEKLAYVTDNKINILNFESWGKESYQLNMDYCRIGDLIWSPSEDKIIFQTRTCTEDDYFEFLSYNLVVLNLSSGTLNQVLSSTEELPRALKWEDENPVYFEKDYSDQAQDKCWVLNFEKGELQSIICP